MDSETGNQFLVHWLHLWAKTEDRATSTQDDATLRYQPLLHHMLDVAAVATLTWENCLTPQLRMRLECSLGKDARIQIVFLSGAHDLGKACPGFQKRVPELSQNSGLPFSANDSYRPHGLISANVLNEVLGSSFVSTVLAQIAGGHHGVFPRTSELRMGRDTLGNNCWNTARRELLQEFASAVGFELNQDVLSGTEIMDPAIVPILAGFISVVDWIGSNQDFFGCTADSATPVEINATQYWRNAQGKAQEALEKLGWLPAVSFARESQFDAVFERKGFAPNTLQVAAIELVERQTSPYLMIVEAPMARGKTEVALFAADMAMCRGFAHGMYVAMPTQATGNAMFKRVLDDYLKQRGHRGKLNLQLVHGDALLAQMEQVEEGEVPEFSPRCIGDDGDVEAQSWFTAKKRPLLAPFGVGTIDQSLLSVLQTKHWFVRLFGLAGKVVIFDEVHAYDAYMSTILERLLHWLAEVDCTVILLSATLPDAKRRTLVKAYSGRDDVEYKRYPRVTLARPRHYPNAQAESSPVSHDIQMEEPHTVDVRFFSTDLHTLDGILDQQLEHGGCAAVICNTVNRSIEVYKHLRETLKGTECLLFHARTLRMWRREREEEVLLKFGKGEKRSDGTYANPNRPARAVLVATQVIEQSLDLDFDLMVSEIAPVDLLLQRSGRLHRHKRDRPAGLGAPQFIVLCVAEASGPPPESFGKSIESVYDRCILLRTWLALRARDEVEVPTEIEELVEAVYGESGMACGDDWTSALEKSRVRMEHDRNEAEKAADRSLVCCPSRPSDLIEEFNSKLADDEDPLVHKAVKAATREGDPSISAVMLPAETELANDPDISGVRALLDRSARLSHRGIFQRLLSDGRCPAEWARSSHLRHARLLRLDTRNQCTVGDYVLTLDEELGIVIEKDGGSG